MTSRSEWPVAKRWAIAGIVTVNGWLTSATRTGATRLRTSVALPAASTSRTLANSTICPIVPSPCVSAAVGDPTLTVSLGDPTTSRFAVSAAVVQLAVVPGRSASGSGRVLPTTSRGSVEVGMPATGVTNVWLPAAMPVDDEARLRPDRYRFRVVPTGYDDALAYAGVAMPVYGTQSRK